MLTRLHVEALLRNELLADYVWDLWDEGAIDEEQAAAIWTKITCFRCRLNI